MRCLLQAVHKISAPIMGRFFVRKDKTLKTNITQNCALLYKKPAFLYMKFDLLAFWLRFVRNFYKKMGRDFAALNFILLSH